MRKVIKSGIYKITNIINGKSYIGSSKNIDARFWEHMKKLYLNIHCNSHLQRSWNKYGKDSFTFGILELCPENKFIEIEDFYISKYQTLNKKHGYNLLSANRQIYSQETREKMSKSRIGKKHSEETKLRMSIGMTNAILRRTPEMKQKTKTLRTGQKKSDETRQKMRASALKRHENMSNEEKKTISTKLKGNKNRMGKLTQN